jgi:hypothetical protein
MINFIIKKPKKPKIKMSKTSQQGEQKLKKPGKGIG